MTPFASPPLTLGWGPGPGSRLLAPGLPDTVVAAPGRLAWPVEGGVVSVEDGVARVWPVGTPQRLGFSPGLVALVERAGGGSLLLDLEAERAQALPWEAWRVLPGDGAVVVRLGGERRLHALPDLDELPLPVGARSGQLLPWPGGRGVCWLAEGTLYRRAVGEGVRVGGSVRGEFVALAVGPGGAALVETDLGTWGAAPRRPLRLLPPASVEGARFSPGGGRALVVMGDEDENVEIDLATATVLARRPGSGRPAGHSPDPCVLDDDEGTVVTLDGTVLLRGFAAAATAAAAGRVFGPAGAAWDLDAGRPAWEDPALLAEHLAAAHDRVAALDQDRVTVLDRDGNRLHRWRLRVPDAAVLGIRWAGEVLAVDLETESLALSPTGRLLGRCAPPAEEPPESSLLGLPVEGTLRHAGRLYAWTFDGMLLALEDPLTPP